jgi:hypothetical protein
MLHIVQKFKNRKNSEANGKACKNAIKYMMAVMVLNINLRNSDFYLFATEMICYFIY